MTTPPLADLVAALDAMPRPGPPAASAPWPEVSQAPPWPPFPTEAFAGLAGEFVALVEPHTEADPVAMLAQFLAAAGCAIGPGPHMRVGADLHGSRLFIVLVGETSRARKGSSLSWVKRVVLEADGSLAPRWQSGLSSGEGLIYAVRDPIEEWRPARRGEAAGFVASDPGVSDKRLLVVEGEFSRTLRVAERDGNVLSEVLRLAWDGAPLQIMTKASPARAETHHVAIVGHVTRDELRRRLTETAMANGFGNRFLWLAVRRSKLLPEGGDLDPSRLRPISEALRRRLMLARNRGEVTLSRAALELWTAVYPMITADRPGLVGALTARAEAQALRLSLIYALLDGAEHVEPEHLLSSMSFLSYSEKSILWIFGQALGDPVADEILGCLRRAPKGLTRTEIRDLFGRNLSGGRIAAALGLLQRCGLATAAQEVTSGRPVERWAALGANDINDRNAKSRGGS